MYIYTAHINIYASLHNTRVPSSNRGTPVARPNTLPTTSARHCPSPPTPLSKNSQKSAQESFYIRT